MPRRPDPAAVAAENRAFLRHLRATGNAHEAARRLGVSRTRFTKRRAADPHFAARWDAALAFAHAALKSSPSSSRGGGRSGDQRHAEGMSQPRSPLARQAVAKPVEGLTAAPPTVVRTPAGRLQLRRPGAARLTPDHEQRFLLALSATANVRLASAAAGLSHATFYARKRTHPGFAREWALALEQGYRRVEAALLAGFEPEAHADADWRANEPPEMPAMTPAQALQLLQLHRKEAAGHAEPPHLKRRRGESREAYSMRLSAMHEARIERDRQRFRIAEAARQTRGEGSPHHRRVVLPALDQVTGWSGARPQPHADGEADRETAQARPAGRGANPSDDAGFTPAFGPAHLPDRTLYSGWRIRDWEERKRRRGE